VWTARPGPRGAPLRQRPTPAAERTGRRFMAGRMDRGVRICLPPTHHPRAMSTKPFPLIADAHLDLAWNAIDWNRDLELPVEQIRRREKDQNIPGKARGENTVSFPELRRGRVGLFIATLLARLHRPGLMPAFQRYDSMVHAYAAGMGQLAYYRALEEQGVLRWIKDARTLDAHVQAWTSGHAEQEPLGFILSMEGADPVLAPEQVQQWWGAGLRI